MEINGKPGRETVEGAGRLHGEVKRPLQFLRWNRGETEFELDRASKTHSLFKGYLQVFDLQRVHVQADDVAGGCQAVAGLDHMTELGLSEELLLR